MQNLQLSHAEGEDAGDGGNYEPVVKGDSGGGLWATDFHSNGYGAEVEQPLYAKLVRWLAHAFIDLQVISCEMIWAKEGQFFLQALLLQIGGFHDRTRTIYMFLL